MCDPVSMGIAMAAGAGLSLMGSVQQANAAAANARAIQQQNQANIQAQNQGFTTRNLAAQAQTAAQTSAMEESLQGQDAAATQMRAQQAADQAAYQQTLTAENAQADQLRQVGDRAAQDLLAKTSADAQQTAQAQRAQQAAALIDQSVQATGPETTDPNTGGSVAKDPATQQALARRTAEAATNIRAYGDKIAKVGAYGAPLQQVAGAISDTRTGIMPAQAAEKLLAGGSDIRLYPAKLAYQGDTTQGAAYAQLAALRGQGALDTAGLSFGNATDIANLTQSNQQQLASNAARQAQANAEAAAARGRIIQGIGNFAAQAGAYYGGGQGISSLFKPGGVIPPSGMYWGTGT